MFRNIAKVASITASVAILKPIYAQEIKSRLEPSSQTNFETELLIGSSNYNLIGLGIRAVTFLNINAYAVAFYMKKTVNNHLLESSRWKQEYTASKWISGVNDAKWFLQDLVKQSGIAIQIVPVRDTDGPHLRNGFIRFLTNRANKGQIKGDEKQLFEESIAKFRTLFSVKSVKKGQVILFEKENNELIVWVNGVLQGSVGNELLTRWFFEQYLKGDTSPSLVASVAEGIANIFK